VVGVNPKAALADADRIDAYVDGKSERMGRGAGWRVKQNGSMSAAISGDVVDTRNPRSVWTIPTHPFKGAHFATFPPELARRCIVAGTPPGGDVLDPFGGSGTVGLVADGLGMNAVLIDLDERNLPMARERITGDAPLFAEVDVA
jgi:DNA modification methylase